MGYKEQIIEILNGNRCTTQELSNRLNITESDVRVYLNRIFKENENTLKVVGTENKYKIYTLNKEPQENGSKLLFLLRNLFNLMENKMNFAKAPDNKDIELIKDIESVIE